MYMLWSSKSSASFCPRGTEAQRREVMSKLTPHCGTRAEGPLPGVVLTHLLALRSGDQVTTLTDGRGMQLFPEDTCLAPGCLQVNPALSISGADRVRPCFSQGTETRCGIGGAMGILMGSCPPLLLNQSLCVHGALVSGDRTAQSIWGTAFCEGPRSHKNSAQTNAI